MISPTPQSGNTGIVPPWLTPDQPRIPPMPEPPVIPLPGPERKRHDR